MAGPKATKDQLFAELESVTANLADLYQDQAVVEFAEITTRSQAIAHGLNAGAAVNATERLADVQARDHRLELTKIRANIRAVEERRNYLILCIEQGNFQ
jgi:hypothetical protein